MLEYLLEEKFNISDYVFIGDRLHTDFKMSKYIGMDFICVLSGETKREDIEDLKVWPNLIVNSVKDLINIV